MTCGLDGNILRMEYNRSRDSPPALSRVSWSSSCIECVKMSRLGNIMHASVECSLVSFRKQSQLSVEEAVKLLRSNLNRTNAYYQGYIIIITSSILSIHAFASKSACLSISSSATLVRQSL